MAIKCMSCQKETPENEASLAHEVLVCRSCAININEFARHVKQQLRDLSQRMPTIVRSLILDGSFRYDAGTRSLEGLNLLVSLLPCPSHQTLHLSPPSPSSGEPLPPHAALLAALGQKGSNSPTG